METDKKPLISIVVPVYNVEKYIFYSMTSIANQTYKNFEVILVNDETPDRSIDVAMEVLEQNRITYKALHKKNEGQGVARDFGINMAEGEWIACVDPDDAIAPCYLEELLNICLCNNADIVCASYKYVTVDTYFDFSPCTKNYQIFDRCTALKKFLNRTGIFALPASLIRKSCIVDNNIKSSDSCRLGEDDYFLWQVLFCAHVVGYLRDTLYNYCQRGNSAMKIFNPQRYISSYEAFDELAKMLSRKYDDNLIQFIMPRNALALLRIAARVAPLESFLRLAKTFEYKENTKKSFKISDWKVRLASSLLFIQPRIFYYAARLERKRM